MKSCSLTIHKPSLVLQRPLLLYLSHLDNLIIVKTLQRGVANGEKWGISQSVYPIPHKINSPFFPIFPHFPPIFYGIFVKNYHCDGVEVQVGS